MGIAASALAVGRNVLTVTNGEELIFRGEALAAVVDRNPFYRTIRTPDFDPRDASRIEVKAGDVDGIPAPGEEFVDEGGIVHRITTVRRLVGFYSCECVSSESALEFLTDEGGEILVGGLEPLTEG